MGCHHSKSLAILFFNMQMERKWSNSTYLNTKLIFKTIKTITVEQELLLYILGTSTSYHENKRQFRI